MCAAASADATGFHGTGLEAFRFEWGILDSLMARDEHGEPTEPLRRWGVRQKSKLAPADLGRNWLCIGDPAKYAAQMKIRHALMTSAEGRQLTFVANGGDASCVRGQAEVLKMMLEWLPRHHPDRFYHDLGAGTINTTTPGYCHTFRIGAFERDPLR